MGACASNTSKPVKVHAILTKTVRNIQLQSLSSNTLYQNRKLTVSQRSSENRSERSATTTPEEVFSERKRSYPASQSNVLDQKKAQLIVPSTSSSLNSLQEVEYKRSACNSVSRNQMNVPTVPSKFKLNGDRQGEKVVMRSHNENVTSLGYLDTMAC